MSVANLVFKAAAPADISDLRNPALWLVNSMGGARSASGQTVSAESAMSLSAVFACLRNLADDIGTMPIKVYDRSADGSKEERSQHPVYALIHDQPNPEMTAADFWGSMIHWAAGWGNALAEIEMDGRMEPLSLNPIHPSRASLHRDRRTNTLYYEVKGDEGAPIQLTQDRIFHLRGFGQGLWGYSAIQYGADSLGLGMALQDFGSAFFSNGINTNGVLETPEELDKDSINHLRTQWAERHAGAGNAFKPIIMYGGMKWTTISVPPEQAQFLESRRFSIEEVARWFRMPLPMIGDLTNAHYNNVESLDLDYAKHTISPWTVRIAQEIKRKLLGEGTLFAEHVMDSLLRADSAARSAYDTAMFRIGVRSRNEIRKSNNWNPIDGGDRFYVEHNLQPVDDDGMPDTGGQDETEPPPPDDEEPPSDDDNPPAEPPPFGGPQQRENAKRAVMPVFVDAFERIITKESKAAARVKDGDAAKWAKAFYSSHGKCVSSALYSAAKTLAVLVCEPGAETVAEAEAVARVDCYAVDWCEAAHDQIVADGIEKTLDQWRRTKAATSAADLVDRLTETDNENDS